MSINLSPSDVFFQALNVPNFIFGRPGPHWGAYNACPDPLVGWGGGYLLPYPPPLDALGISVFFKLSGYAYVPV